MDARLRPQGSLLIMTLMVSTSLIFLMLWLLTAYSTEQHVSASLENDVVAEAAANAGIDQAMYQLQSNGAWTIGFNGDVLPQSQATYTVAFGNAPLAYRSTNNASGASVVTGYNGRQVSPGFVHVVSVGRYNTSVRVEEALLTVISPIFQSAAFATGNLQFNGNINVDSWNSSQGTYSATVNANGGGVGTNAISAGSVNLNGNVNAGLITVLLVPPGPTVTPLTAGRSPQRKLPPFQPSIRRSRQTWATSRLAARWCRAPTPV